MLDNNYPFDISKPLDDTDKRIIARNLDMIEREKKSLSHARDDWEQDQLIKKHEESERRMIREREESERRITQEREQLERERQEREEEHAENMLAIEKELARERARKEEESYQRMLDHQLETKRREMAVSYTEYDRYHELYYYYDERGDYLDAETARRRWQKLHAPSHLEFDPDDPFWEFFTDSEGKLITRDEAFDIWQLKNCPDYLSYSPDAIWTKYRCGDVYISADEARERWLTECADTDGVRAYRVGEKVLEIGKTAANGVVKLPDIGSDDKEELYHKRTQEINREMEAAKAANGRAVKWFALIDLVVGVMFFVSIAIYDLKGKGPNPSNSFWAQRGTWIFFGISTLVFFGLFYFGDKIAKSKVYSIEKPFKDKRDKLWEMESAFDDLIDELDSVRQSLDFEDRFRRGDESADTCVCIYKEKEKAYKELLKSELPVDHLRTLGFDYFEVTARFDKKLLLKPYNKELARMLCAFGQRNVSLVLSDDLQRFIDKGSRSITIGFLKQGSAERISAVLTDLGVETKITSKSVVLFKSVSL